MSASGAGLTAKCIGLSVSRKPGSFELGGDVYDPSRQILSLVRQLTLLVLRKGITYLLQAMLEVVEAKGARVYQLR